MMHSRFIITLSAVLGLIGAAPATAGIQKLVVDGYNVEAELITIKDTRDFVVFIAPNRLKRSFAFGVATRMAVQYCAGTLGAHKVRFNQTKRRTRDIPDAWSIDGTCE